MLAPAAAILFSLQQPKLYEASAQVLVGSQSTPAVTGIASQTLETQSQLARVPDLARRVVRSAGLDEGTAGAFLGASSVQRRADSSILVFSVRDADPALAAKLATAYAREFTEYRLDFDTAAVRRALEEIRERLDDLAGARNSTAYATLVAKEQELQTALALQLSSSFIVWPAEGAGQVQPRPTRNAVLGLLLGIVLGIGLAVLREALDVRIRSAEEVRERLGLPLLGRLAAPPGRLRKKDDLAMLADPAGMSAEAFRMLRTSIELARLERDVRTILVTSAVEREGKSTTAANLALAYARAGHRTVLVDLDFRRPYLDRFFKLDGRPGVTQVALGRAGLREATVPVFVKGAEGLPGSNGSGAEAAALTVIGTGPVPPDPGEFVATTALAEILAALRERADIVLVDAPPLLPVGDAVTIAQHVDAVLLVARMNMLQRPMLRDVRRLLEAIAAPKLGFVATAAETDEGYKVYPSYYEAVHRKHEPVG